MLEVMSMYKITNKITTTCRIQFEIPQWAGMPEKRQREFERQIIDEMERRFNIKFRKMLWTWNGFILYFDVESLIPMEMGKIREFCNNVKIE
jgi:hypothetical protein